MCNGIIFLDLEDVDNWDCPQDIDVAVICGSVTNLRLCRDNPVQSERVNVKGVATVTKKLVDKDTFVIFLSTSQVFDGAKPLRKADESSW